MKQRSTCSLLLFTGTVTLLAGKSLVQSSPVQRKPRSLLQSASRPSPRVQSILASGLKQTVVDYKDHPFDHHQRQLDEEFEPDHLPLNYGNRDTIKNHNETYETLRIKYIMDPIEAQPDYFSSGFDQSIPDILDIVSETWSKHLSVYPVDETIPIDQQDCYSFFSSYVTPQLEASGVANADMAIYVGAETAIIEQGQVVELCETGTLAFAFTCAIDQYDRPVIGAINFCINNIQRRRRELEEEEENARKLEMSLVTEKAEDDRADALEGNDAKADLALLAIHEVCHALGFTIDLLKYFRDPTTGEPLTPRPFTPTNVRCADGSVQSLEFPATNTVMTRQTPDDRIFHEVVTPRVTQVARNQFNCQSMTGARLENQPTSAGFSCVGSHWDERLFLSELMGPIFSGYSDILSPLTLAFLEDSGWYKVSYENAKLSPYGKGSGCDFVNEPCIVNDQVPEYGREVFCNTPSTFTDNGITASQLWCDPTHKSVTACDLFDINDMPSDVAALLPSDRIPRFSDPNLVSIFDRADFCPLPIVDARLDCTNNEDNADIQVYRGESRGLDSRCINGQIGSTAVPGCFQIECDAARHKVIIDGQVCDEAGQQLIVSTVDFQSATLICPVLETICPDLFCPGECSGRGVCDYDSEPPRCICADTSDTTAACSASVGLPPSPSSPPPPTLPPINIIFPTSSAPVQGMTVVVLATVMLAVVV